MTDLPKKFQDAIDRANGASPGPWKCLRIENGNLISPNIGFANANWNGDFISFSRTDIPLFAEALKIAMEALKVYAKGPDLRMGDDDHHIVSHENGMAGMLRFTIMMKDSDVAKDALDAIERLGGGE